MDEEAAKPLASTTSEADESFPPFGWRIVNTCLELTFLSSDLAVSALSQLQELRYEQSVKAVVADTNEEEATHEHHHS